MFTPDRFSAEEIPQIAKDSGRAVKGLAKRFFHLPGNTVSMIEPGQASVVETPEGAAGVYRAEDNRIYQVTLCVPIWDAGLCGIRRKDHGTAPAMDPDLIIGGSFQSASSG